MSSRSGLTVVSVEAPYCGEDASSSDTIQDTVSELSAHATEDSAPSDPPSGVFPIAPKVPTDVVAASVPSETVEVEPVNTPVGGGLHDSPLPTGASFTHQGTNYAGDLVDDSDPIPEGGYRVPLQFPSPAFLVSFFDKAIADGRVTLYPWQLEISEQIASAKCSAQHPCKIAAVASNGSGKDKFVIAPFAVWFTLSKIRSRVIITTASGTQLTSQTEPYIKDLCEKVNAFFGQTVFKIRQRYIKCLLTGSEIRMFATDEAGKAEGYHPIDPDSEMAIVVNEGKSVTEEIHQALRRCTGYNYWIEVSSTGEPKGFFYQAATDVRLKFWTRYVTSYECNHISPEEIEQDRLLDGESSAFFRSKHLSQFTSLGGCVVIPLELVNKILKHKEFRPVKIHETRIGIDLAAGGDENAICFTRGNKCIKEIQFRETDTTITADRIDFILTSEGISKDYPLIFADDGGVGHSIIDMLVRKGWNINRINNQWAALGNKKQFGNRGAENWYRAKRILEELCFDIATLSEKTREQLYNRYYKQSQTGGRIFLQSKKEAKAEGHPSPDRADAFILSLSGLTVDDFIEKELHKVSRDSTANAPVVLSTPEMERHYEDKVTFANFNKREHYKATPVRAYTNLRQRVNGSLRNALKSMSKLRNSSYE